MGLLTLSLPPCSRAFGTDVAVAAHCDILRWIVDAEASDRDWTNAEAKVFGFASSDMSQPLVELTHIKGAKPAETVNRDELEAEEELAWEAGLEKEKKEAWDVSPDTPKKGDKAVEQHIEDVGGREVSVAA